ncbi:MAG: sigma-70 family RNA polymerase sigma factor [Proteobacteria bacterium]|jgi:RNA polymerase sigma-70 factor (ECF subfamily)|nr:sigma-70 family RNA polymerase sigma factor [Pseudomonadota bacterium]
MKKLPTDRGAETGHQADLSLAREAAAGDEKARRQLVERLMDRVRNTVYYMAAGHADTEDLAQLTFIQLLKSIGSFRGQSSLQSWAARITARTVMREIRKTRTYQSRFVDAAVVETEIESDRRVDNEADEQRVSARIAVALAELKPKYRQTLVLRLVEEYDLKEIAELMDTNVYTVRYRLRVGRKKLGRLVRRDPLLAEKFEGVRR